MPCASQYAGWQRPPANARLTRTDTYVAEGGRADLVWPEDAPRLARLQSALRIGKREPPQIVQGDLRRDLPSSIEQAPADATVVVYHSAVLNYIAEPAQRHEFARSMQASRCVWISNVARWYFRNTCLQTCSSHPVCSCYALIVMRWPGQTLLAPPCNGYDPAIPTVINVGIAMERCERPLSILTPSAHTFQH
ncbi:MAG: DUF2332 family protein [Achromobacter mucicolens]|uniref:DUF2332 family protein n=1 Tax=Achromobacter mucicolens TaxID=1389922 RepID=UPI003D151933